MRWTPEEDQRLVSLHGDNSIEQISEALGRTMPSVRGRITRLGLSKKTYWTDEQIVALVSLYEQAGDGVLELTGFAESIGKNKANVCRKAKELGLGVNSARRKRETLKPARMFESKDDLREHQRMLARKRISQNGHPKGMKGKKHSDQSKRAISVASAARWSSLSDAEKSSHTLHALKQKAKKHGNIAGRKPHGNWKAGWRTIGGRRIYFRSRWEANYGRYLEWLKSKGQIMDWQHEPETFWFEQIKRGVRSYLPDFRVWENDGNSALHEVKGWMDSRSRTTLKRMAKYHPHENIVLIDEKRYREIKRKVSTLIEGWESDKKSSRAAA